MLFVLLCWYHCEQLNLCESWGQEKCFFVWVMVPCWDAASVMLCAHFPPSLLLMSHPGQVPGINAKFTEKNDFWKSKMTFSIQHIRVLKILSPLFSVPSLRPYNNFSHTFSFIPFGCIVRGRRDTLRWFGSYGYGENCVGYWLKRWASVLGYDTHGELVAGYIEEIGHRNGIRPGISLSILPPPLPLSLYWHHTGIIPVIFFRYQTVSTLC